jgi:hypothetical protein
MTGQAYLVASKMAEKQGSVNEKGKYEVHVGGKGSYVEDLLEKSTVTGFGDANNIELDTTNGYTFL